MAAPIFSFDDLQRLARNYEYNTRYGLAASENQRIAHDLLRNNKITEDELRAVGARTRGMFGGAKGLHINDWAHHGEIAVANREHAVDMAELGTDHKYKLNGAKNEAELALEKAKHGADHKILLEKHIKDLEWKNKSAWEKISHGWGKTKGAALAPGEWAHAKLKTGAKWGVAAAAVGGALAYFTSRSAEKAGHAAAEEMVNNAGDPGVGVMTADAMQPQLPEPIGMGPKGPIYGEHTARANGMDEGKAIPPRMNAAPFEDATTAAQKYASKDTGGQPSLAV